MNSPAHLFLLLQHGDTFFPSGAVSFSWGLEGAFNEGWVVEKSELADFLEIQLRNRWASYDRAFLQAAHANADNGNVIAELDNLVEAMSLAEEQRIGSYGRSCCLVRLYLLFQSIGCSHAAKPSRTCGISAHSC